MRVSIYINYMLIKDKKSIYKNNLSSKTSNYLVLSTCLMLLT